MILLYSKEHVSMAEAQVTEIIANLEDQTWKVLSNSGKDLLPFLSSDCMMSMPYGMQLSAASEPSLEEVMTSDAFVPWKSYRLSNVVVTPVGSEGAVINYRVKASRPDPDGKEGTFRALVASVWRKDPSSGAWQICFHQQTPYDHTPEDMI